ncbi:MoxR family ATPase [Micromonospora arborensis]|uniref:AAA family ATPase n=1 Tax=Micromonospora arborensis TaxID=2116518 RepID=UPI0033C3A215
MERRFCSPVGAGGPETRVDIAWHAVPNQAPLESTGPAAGHAPSISNDGSPVHRIDRRADLTESQSVPNASFSTPERIAAELAKLNYLAEPGLAAAIFLAKKLKLPLFLEGDPGVGKTALARKVGLLLGVEPIRLQCYSGIDRSQALYEWDFARQLLHLRGTPDTKSIYCEEFLIARPILQAVEKDPSVLLIDEIDRADDEFEAFLLEVLEGDTLSIPDYRTIVIKEPPFVILTSNGTREVHGALKRRCVYHWISHPTRENEAEIIRLNVPEVANTPLAGQIAAAMAQLRQLPLVRPPGVAESIAFARAALALGRNTVAEAADDALGVLVKQHEDEDAVRSVLRSAR